MHELATNLTDDVCVPTVTQLAAKLYQTFLQQPIAVTWPQDRLADPYHSPTSGPRLDGPALHTVAMSLCYRTWPLNWWGLTTGQSPRMMGP